MLPRVRDPPRFFSNRRTLARPTNGSRISQRPYAFGKSIVFTRRILFHNNPRLKKKISFE